MRTCILHVALRTDWAQATETGSYGISSRGMSLLVQGFIHASTSRQVVKVLADYYADLAPEELVLLVLDVDALDAAGSPVRWDPVPGSDEPYPHIYGPIPPVAVVEQVALGGVRGAIAVPDLTWRGVVSHAPHDPLRP